MKSSYLSFLALVLEASLTSAKVRRDLGRKNVEVAELSSSAQIDHDAQEVLFIDPTSDFEDVFRCSKRMGKQLTFSADQKFIACCAPGQTLVGSPETAFDCCGAGHELAGCGSTGYSCCPIGQMYDGKICKPTDPVCTNGRVLVDGKCVCPGAQIPTPEGGCKPPCTGDQCGGAKPPPQVCSSGLSAGKCYTFTWENGYRLGYHHSGWYTASKDSRHHQFGKFQLCKDDSCTPGSINPNDGFRIKDIHGQANGGQNPRQWLNNAQNGGHITKTPDYSKAGVFSLTKWPCGKYCLGGIDAGIGPTCPSEDPAVTFTTFDKQSCVPIEVTEVPCDIRAVENNCIWKSGKDQCCGKIDCSLTK